MQDCDEYELPCGMCGTPIPCENWCPVDEGGTGGLCDACKGIHEPLTKSEKKRRKRKPNRSGPSSPSPAKR